jgi:protein Mpv17
MSSTAAARASRGLAGRLWSGYLHQLDTRPLLTKSFTSFSGFVVGDAIAQLYAGEKYDYWRTARFAAYGFIIHAPACHVWYGILDSRVYPKAPTSPRAVVAKMAIDQLLFTPFATLVFYSIIKTMEGEAHKITSTIKEKFWPTLLAGYTVWPLAHIINFRFIAGNQRVLYINVVNVAWNVILCKIATSKPRSTPEDEKPERAQV